MRPEKNLIVERLEEEVNSSPYVLLTDYAGMNMDHFNELRNRLAETKSEFRVIKNTLLKRALHDWGVNEFDEHLTGQSAVVLGESDVCSAVKVLKTFVSEFEKPEVKVGILDKTFLTRDNVLALADLPPIEVLRAKILGLIEAPASKLVGVLIAPQSKLVRTINVPLQQLVQVFKAYSEKGNG